ncbi:MAG: hypothetical protein P0Y53_11860 [Candidatus Pseudobacter hemicellulosilyticus]|uniref:Uncharacterized protein n=1 Tax=Candidatus Pseudobacter hemicellulosilyticus TaxID=3121375 RepID=A0AAJ5WZ18_9BACT|nr:MAG: hypothetical protein P0Y53_11860 [Pseudobacter sp.]
MINYLLYVDPGSGSYLIQLIIAAILGALFYFKNLWWRIRSFFSKTKKDDNTRDGDGHE